ncbi:MAG: hypothetical protein IIT40_12150 [Prevotella sp.]|jgi:hypothetical protein|nr:hypothetical protein [Prevotella sp.]
MSGTHYEEKTFWFTDNESGEDFFVEAADSRTAKAIAREYFGYDIVSHGYVTKEFAEMQGWDTY